MLTLKLEGIFSTPSLALINISQTGHTIQYTIGGELEAHRGLIEGCLNWISQRSCLKFVEVKLLTVTNPIFITFNSSPMLGTGSNLPHMETTTNLDEDAGPTLAGSQWRACHDRNKIISNNQH